ncbi:immunity 8 family protein [Agromyces mediolanus]|nr:immunity 8 family protein [Agromyces mediolanus]
MSSDVDIATYVSPDRRNDAVWLRMLVGPAGESGEESFDVLVCTPLWLADDAVARDRPRIGRHLLIVEELDLRVACDFLCASVESVVGDDWNAIGERIARIGYWEFEDYHPSRHRPGS